MDIKFKITLVLEDTFSNDFVEVSKNIIKRDIDLEVGIPLEIDKKNLEEYFDRDIKRHCISNNIEQKFLLIDGYEIQSMDAKVDVFFKSEDLREFSLEPIVCARLVKELDRPTLRATQVSNTSIKWKWDYTDNAHYLMDEKDNIIANVPLGLDYYVESELDTDKTYKRYLVAYNENYLSDKSEDCIITLIPEVITSIYTKFKREKRTEEITSHNVNHSSRLRAFASGIGDGEDCKILKSDDMRYAKRFKLINKVYGVRASKEVKHHTIKFFYRFKLKGLVDYKTYTSNFKIHVVAREIVNLCDEPSLLEGAPIVCERELLYTTCDNSDVVDVYIYQILQGMNLDNNKRYKFDIRISDINGCITLYTRTHGQVELNSETGVFDFSEKGFFNHKFSVKAHPVIVPKEYEEVYPALQYEPLVGAVNGDFEVSEDGLKNLVASAPVFDTSLAVYDKKYYCILEEISPREAHVNYKFNNQVENESFTCQNGDGITFSSNAILEDNAEIRDFIAQIEEGEYSINDNRKHSYRYPISEIEVDEESYKRFEIDVISNSNDVVILDSTTDLDIVDGKIDSYVDVSVRAIQNAIAKWNPIIHNGYYYYNQEEYYLYSRCISDGKGKILDEIYYKPTISYKVTVDIIEPAGEIEIYNEAKNTRDELLLDEKLFFYMNEKIWPKPINLVEDYYMDFLEEYTYKSEPFKFNKKPTAIDSITWNETCLPPNRVMAYAVAYNDVHGEWEEPVLISNGGEIPFELRPSQVMRLDFKLRPSRLPNLKKRSFDVSCHSEWLKQMDTYLSYNYYIKEEVLKLQSDNSSCVIISKVLDLGDTAAEEKKRAIEFEVQKDGLVEYFIQESDKIEDFEAKLENGSWESIAETGKKNIKRFVRYKIVLRKGSKVFNMKLNVDRYEYTGMDMEEYMPGIGGLTINATHNPAETSKRFERVTAFDLDFDGKEHVLIENTKEYFDIFGQEQGFDSNRIKSYSIDPFGAQKKEFSIDYIKSVPVAESQVNIRSHIVVHDYDKIERNQNGVTYPVVESRVEVSPIPQQYSPIIVYEKGEEEPLTNVFFVGEDGEYTLTNTEVFESLGFRTLYLESIGIDKTSLYVEVDGKTVYNYKLKQSVLEFDKEIEAGSIIVVQYKIENSYCFNYEYESDKAVIQLHKKSWMPFDEVKVFIETNKVESTRKINDICLNPIYNTRYAGYIYICDYELDPHLIEIIPEYDYIHANGKDQLSVILRVTDKNGNPIENVDVNVTAALGKIEKDWNKTDVNGLISCTYTSWTGSCHDKIKAVAIDNVRAEEIIVNRKL